MQSNDVTLSQVISTLREEGIRVAPYQIHYLLQTGRITRPAKDAAGNYRFTEEVLDQLRAKLSTKGMDCNGPK